MRIVADDLFAGPGGWSVATRMLEIEERGFETDLSACNTRRAADFETVGPRTKEEVEQLHGDVRNYSPRYATELVNVRLYILIASPPCQTFSAAGKGAGRKALDVVLRELDHLVKHGYIRYDEFDDVRTGLVLEPLRWIMESFGTGKRHYDAIALEQVPSVLPVWEAYAVVLRRMGYSVVTGIAHAEQYGVPQTRRRAVLIAKRRGEAKLPTPTHSKYHTRSPERLDEGVKKWVTMADALHWGPDGRPSALRSNYGTNGDKDNRGERTVDQPAATITSKSQSNTWLMGDVRSKNGAVRRSDQPAATITASADNGNFRWVHERPATTVQGDPRIGAPGHKHMGAGCCKANPDGAINEAQFENKSLRLSLAECAALQTFPGDYPFQGTNKKKHEQVGNAVPPRLALHILKEVIG